MDKRQILAALRTYLTTEVLGDDGEDLMPTTPILELGIIDSLSMLGLLSFIDEQLDISVPDEDVRPENFNSLDSLSAFLAGLPRTSKAS
ncbi:MAG TPA: acyl carrier protein [Kofleriaceae bacterium]|nr:acyl carrier protein [Kofleriaceae bacterium]